MATFNDVTLIGHLVRDPELKSITGGKNVCTFTLGINRKYKSGNEQKSLTCFIDINVWGAIGEAAAKYLKRGREVLINGTLDQNTWKDKDGHKRSRHMITAKQVIYLENVTGSRNSPPAETEGEEITPPDDDDIPF